MSYVFEKGDGDFLLYRSAMAFVFGYLFFNTPSGLFKTVRKSRRDICGEPTKTEDKKIDRIWTTVWTICGIHLNMYPTDAYIIYSKLLIININNPNGTAKEHTSAILAKRQHPKMM